VTRHQTALFRQLLTLVDVVLSAGAFVGTALLLNGIPAHLGAGARPTFDAYTRALLVMVPLWAIALRNSRTVDFRVGYGRMAFRFARATGISLVLLVIISFWFRFEFLSRTFVLALGVLQFSALVSARILLTEAIKRMKNVDDHRILLVGRGERALSFAQTLRERSSWNSRILGHVSVPDEVGLADARPVLGDVSQLAHILDTEVVDEVIFAVPGRSAADFEGALAACDERGVDVLLTIPPAVPYSGNVELANLTGFNMPMLGLTRTPTADVQLVAKRFLDVICSLLGIIVLSPVLAVTAIAIKIDDPGPVLFKQVRSGRNGRRFTMLKFRSMCIDAEAKRIELEKHNEMAGPVFKMRHDPRITRVGRFIRKTSIDELPQLFNVLVGTMSLVGPRPPLPSEVAQYEPWQRRRLSVRPGITGMWQVSGRNNISFDEWMQLDLKYIDTWSLWLDLKILFKTLPAVLTHRGAS